MTQGNFSGSAESETDTEYLVPQNNESSEMQHATMPYALRTVGRVSSTKRFSSGNLHHVDFTVAVVSRISDVGHPERRTHS